jgi:hypothetical protein
LSADSDSITTSLTCTQSLSATASITLQTPHAQAHSALQLKISKRQYYCTLSLSLSLSLTHKLVWSRLVLSPAKIWLQELILKQACSFELYKQRIDGGGGSVEWCRDEEISASAGRGRRMGGRNGEAAALQLTPACWAPACPAKHDDGWGTVGVYGQDVCIWCRRRSWVG